MRGTSGCPQPRAISPALHYPLLFLSDVYPRLATFQHLSPIPRRHAHHARPRHRSHRARLARRTALAIFPSTGAIVNVPDQPVLRETARQLAEYFAGSAASSICRSNCAARISSVRSGRAARRSHLARRAATARSRDISATRPRCAPSAPRTAAIRSRSSRRATASSARTARSRVSAAGSTPRRGCSRTRRRSGICSPRADSVRAQRLQPQLEEFPLAPFSQRAIAARYPRPHPHRGPGAATDPRARRGTGDTRSSAQLLDERQRARRALRSPPRRSRD